MADKPNTLYSLFDKDKGDYLNTGLNSKTRKEAINDGIDFILSDGGTSNVSEIKRMSLKIKEMYLAGHNLFVDVHTEELVVADEDF